MTEADLGAAARSRPAMLVFVHVPKTAGSTLRSVLNMNEPGARSRALGNVFKGGGGIDRAVMARMQKGEGPDLTGVGIVRGHFPLGIREYLPSHLPKRRDLQCFTFLRQPVERTLSHYYAIRDRREGEEEPGKHAKSPLPPDPSLDDALDAGYVHDNLHTRMLCGDPEPFGEVTEEMLDAAKRNLRDELVFFGLTERFDESLVLAKRRLGLDAILYRSSGRVNPERPRGDQVPAELRRAAERSNRYDIELYRYAKELFESELESARDLEFEVDLAALKAAKGDGELAVEGPIPTSFNGDEQAWGMLVRANATAQRLEQKLAGVSSRAASDRARTRVLKQEVERRETAPERLAELEDEVERLRPVASKAVELEREIQKLRAATSTSGDGETRVEQASGRGGRRGNNRARRGGRKGDRAGYKQQGSKRTKQAADGDAPSPGDARSKREGRARRRKPRRQAAAAAELGRTPPQGTDPDHG
jgi:hypothetical protein